MKALLTITLLLAVAPNIKLQTPPEDKPPANPRRTHMPSSPGHSAEHRKDPFFDRDQTKVEDQSWSKVKRLYR